MQHRHNRNLLAVAGIALFMSGCAAQSGWSPTVDTYGDSRAQNVTHDKVECDQLARQTGGSTVEKGATGALAGGALGAVSGAAIGAITGNTGRGAALGGVIGGIGGAAHQANAANQQYKTAYINCMRNRGHHVIN